MPRPLYHPDDRNPKIYSMQSLASLEYYVGSTRQLFRTRINMHKCNYRAGHNTTRASKILKDGEFIAQVLEYLPADITAEGIAARKLHHINQLRREGKTVINCNTNKNKFMYKIFEEFRRYRKYNESADKLIARRDKLDQFADEIIRMCKIDYAANPEYMERINELAEEVNALRIGRN
jgi:hypothetical protein